MKAPILSILLSMISFIQCSISENRTNYKKMYEEHYAAQPDQHRVLHLPKNGINTGFLKLLQTMTAINMKLKYELGEQLTKIIYAMEDADRQAHNPVPSRSAVNEDTCPSWNIYEQYVTGGWDSISASLGEKSDHWQVKNKLLAVAIKHENIDLVRDMINHQVLFISYDIYRFAIRNAFTAKTEISEIIVNEIANSADNELGTIPNFTDRLELGLANIKVYDFIVEHEFPMLERALKEGLNPNTRIVNVGSLLGISVMVQCYQCAKLLIEFGADIDAQLEYEETLQTPAIGEDITPKGWSLLMVSVAYGYKRLIQLLIESGARVSYIPQGREEERFHARAVARMIKDSIQRLSILRLLNLNSSEKDELLLLIHNETFLQAISSANFALVDTFLLLFRNDGTLPIQIPEKQINFNQRISEMLNREDFTFLCAS